MSLGIVEVVMTGMLCMLRYVVSRNAPKGIRISINIEISDGKPTLAADR